MPLPQMGNVLTAFEQTVILKSIVQTVVDHRPVDTPTPNPIQAVVQVAQKEKLQIEIINWSLQYLMVHSKATISMNDLIEYKGKDFKIVDLGDYDDYGFREAIAEEVK